MKGEKEFPWLWRDTIFFDRGNFSRKEFLLLENHVLSINFIRVNLDKKWLSLFLRTLILSGRKYFRLLQENWWIQNKCRNCMKAYLIYRSLQVHFLCWVLLLQVSPLLTAFSWNYLRSFHSLHAHQSGFHVERCFSLVVVAIGLVSFTAL